MCTHRPSHLAYERRRASAFTRTRTVNHSNRYMTRLPCQRPHENRTLAPSSLAEGNAEQGRPQLGGQAQVRRLDVRDIAECEARTLKRISWLRRAVASCQMAGRLPPNSVKALLTAEATGPAPYLALSDLVPRPMPVSVRGALLRFVPHDPPSRSASYGIPHPATPVWRPHSYRSPGPGRRLGDRSSGLGSKRHGRDWRRTTALGLFSGQPITPSPKLLPGRRLAAVLTPTGE